MINLATQVAAILAHGLTWAAVVYLLFVPVYESQRTTAVAQGQPAVIINTTTSTSSTLLEVNGLEIIPVILVPVLLTGFALLGVVFTKPGRAARKAILLTATVLTFGFCALAMFSVGIFYLPGAVALLVSAILGLSQTQQRVAR